MLNGDADNPLTDSWGGRFRATSHGPNYYTDRTEAELAEGQYDGAKTVNIWRTDYLDDWEMRMDRALAANDARKSSDQTGPNDQLVVFPNPSKGTVNVSVDEASDLVVLDILERTVKSLSQVNGIIKFNLTPGTYLIKATSANGSTVKKISIE